MRRTGLAYSRVRAKMAPAKEVPGEVGGKEKTQKYIEPERKMRPSAEKGC